MSITTYDPATGEIHTVRSAPTLEELEALIGGASFVEGAFSPLFYEIDPATGEAIEKPA